MRLIIFAVSVKNRGYCVVGKNVENPSEWVRLVGDASGRELSGYQIMVNDGVNERSLQPLDVVDVSFETAPLPYQPENKVLKSMGYVKSENVVNPFFLDKVVQLYNRTAPFEEPDGVKMPYSVRLVKVSNLRIDYNPPQEIGGKPKTYAHFNCGFFSYRGYRVADPRCRENVNVGDAILCVSLAGPFNPPGSINGKTWYKDRHYKIVAAVYKC